MTKTQGKKSRVDVHEQVTAQIISSIEAGAGTWQMPWHAAGKGLNCPDNIDTKNSYRGINILALWVASMSRGFQSGTWGTYRQWQNRGCQVRKGEKSSIVVFYKKLAEKEGQEDRPRLVARASAVFNADQVDGYVSPALPQANEEMPKCEVADSFTKRTKADIRHGGARAYYRIDLDFIQIPDAGAFQGSKTSSASDTYYQTLLHELTHWTGAKKRCDRSSMKKRFGDEAYAMEELVAELGAAFLCADLGLAQEPRADHAAYIENWLKVLKSDNRAIFTAASQASKAVDYLQGLQ